MASIVVLGAGIGGMSAAYELRALLGKEHSIQVIGEGDLPSSFAPRQYETRDRVQEGTRRLCGGA